MTTVVRGLVQATREAIVAALDTAPALVALTGRAMGNVVPWRPFGAGELPVIAYTLVDATRTGAPGDTRTVLVQFSAFATAEPPEVGGADEGGQALAEALLDGVEQTLTALVLAQLVVPLDASVFATQRRPRAYDDETGAFGADLDVVMTVRR